MYIEILLKVIPAIVLAIGGAIGGWLLKEFNFYRKHKKEEEKKEMTEDVNEDLSEIKNQMKHHEEVVEKEICQHDALYFEKLESFEQAIMDILIPIKKATLTSHYRSLLSRCKEHIRAGYITFDELEQLGKDYETYADLGGNGHMELWMARVRKLPIK